MIACTSSMISYPSYMYTIRTYIICVYRSYRSMNILKMPCSNIYFAQNVLTLDYNSEFVGFHAKTLLNFVCVCVCVCVGWVLGRVHV